MILMRIKTDKGFHVFCSEGGGESPTEENLIFSIFFVTINFMGKKIKLLGHFYTAPNKSM